MADSPFRYCLNTSTIREQGLALVDEFELVAEAGYDGIEPWIKELDAYAEGGGSLADLGTRAGDLGLRIENAIGFFEWIVDDDALRAKGFEEARRNFAICQEIGCPLLAAPPFGATDVVGLDLRAATERYAALVDVGREFGVVPIVEFWGMSKSLSLLGEAVKIAMDCGWREARILADVFHMHKAGSPYEGLALLGPNTLGLLHMNDFPGGIDLDTITDADRVHPGDGVAPLGTILRDLKAIGYRGALSLELFNADYWSQPAAQVAETGLARMKAAVAAALGAEA